jgi:hypothetical protein
MSTLTRGLLLGAMLVVLSGPGIGQQSRRRPLGMTARWPLAADPGGRPSPPSSPPVAHIASDDECVIVIIVS